MKGAKLRDADMDADLDAEDKLKKRKDSNLQMVLR
jgi:hypothetical protein